MPIRKGQQFEILEHKVTRTGGEQQLHVKAVRTLEEGTDGFFRVPRGGAVCFSFPYNGPADLDDDAIQKRVVAAYEAAKRAPEALHDIINRRYAAEEGLAVLEVGLTEGEQLIAKLRAQKAKLEREIEALEAKRAALEEG